MGPVQYAASVHKQVSAMLDHLLELDHSRARSCPCYHAEVEGQAFCFIAQQWIHWSVNTTCSDYDHDAMLSKKATFLH